MKLKVTRCGSLFERNGTTLHYAVFTCKLTDSQDDVKVLKCIVSRLSVSLFHQKQTLAAGTDLVHLIHMRWVTVELYKDRDLFASASPRHDTLGSEG